MANAAAQFTLVEKCVLPVSGNVNPSALVFGDADNDDFHDAELVIGTLNGELLVYKGTNILCSATDLGSIIWVCVDDVLNVGRNFVCAIAAEGSLFVYEVKTNGEMVHRLTMDLPHNVSAACVAKPNENDEVIMLIVATEDDFIFHFNLSKTAAAAAARDKDAAFTGPEKVESKNVLERKLLLEDAQVETISCIKSADNVKAGLFGVVSEGRPNTASFYVHYGSTFVRQSLPNEDSLPKNTSAAVEEKMFGKTLASDQLKHSSLPSGLFTAVSHHGDVALYRLMPLMPRLDCAATADDIATPLTQQLWMHHIDDVPVLSLSLVNLHGPDQPPVIVVCCWNGVTHLFDVEGHHAMFSFFHNVQSFAAGLFALEPGRPSMCFAYTTFHHMIVLYHHVECMCLPSRTLIDTICSDHEVSELLSELISPTSIDRSAEAYSIIRSILQHKSTALNQCILYADSLQDRVAVLQQQLKQKTETANASNTSASEETTSETTTTEASSSQSSSSPPPEQHTEQNSATL